MMALNMHYSPNEKRHAFYQTHFEKYEKLNDYILEMYDVI